MITYKGIAAGLGNRYAIIYRKTDGFVLNSVGAFESSTTISDAEFQAALILVSEFSFQSGKKMGRYYFDSGSIARDGYNVSIFDSNTALPDDDPEQNFDFNADGSGGAVQGGGEVELSDTVCAKIADIVMRRHADSIENSADGDTLDKDSFYGAMRQIQRSSLAGTTLTIKKSDGTTLGTRPVTADVAAEPVTSVGG